MKNLNVIEMSNSILLDKIRENCIFKYKILKKYYTEFRTNITSPELQEYFFKNKAHNLNIKNIKRLSEDDLFALRYLFESRSSLVLKYYSNSTFNYMDCVKLLNECRYNSTNTSFEQLIETDSPLDYKNDIIQKSIELAKRYSNINSKKHVGIRIGGYLYQTNFLDKSLNTDDRIKEWSNCIGVEIKQKNFISTPSYIRSSKNKTLAILRILHKEFENIKCKEIIEMIDEDIRKVKSTTERI